MRILGIDPGINGGLAVWDGDHHDLYLYEIPKFKNEKGKQEVDWRELTSVFLELIEPMADFTFIEDVHSMPKQGVASTFKFGYICGALRCLGESVTQEVHLVAPQKWKKHFGLIGSDKNASREKAIELFNPYLWDHQHDLLMKKKNDGLAEAALIAFYGECMILGERRKEDPSSGM